MRIGTNGFVALGVVFLIVAMVFAISHQEFNWWVFPFGLLFCTIFSGILAVCFNIYREGRFRRASIKDYPDEPWMWDARWRTDIMSSRSKSEFWGTVTITIILGIFTIGGIISLSTELPKGNLWVLLNIIPIVGMFYFGRNSYLALKNWRMERQVRLINETLPAWVGESFSAIIEMPTKIQAKHVHIEASLEHFKVVRREEGDGITFEKVNDIKLPAKVEHIDEGRTRISVEIPENNPATSWCENEQKRWWDLVVMIEVSGRPAFSKISLRYEIPVAERITKQTSET